MGSITFKSLLIALVIAGSSGCSSLLYVPTNKVYVRPERLNLNYEEVVLNSQSKKIYGWHFKHAGKGPPKGFILFFHGNGQNRSAHYLALAWILEQGYDYFIFDYQGYGESEGEPSPEGTVKDGLAALNWFTERAKQTPYAEVPLHVFAQSLGGPIALRSLEEFQKLGIPGGLKQLKFVILESTFLSYQKAASTLLSQRWFTFLFQPFAYLLLSDQWSPKNDLLDLPKARYLVMHGDQDRTVDLKLGQELYAVLPEPKKWLLIEGGGHISTFFIRDGYYRQSVLAILEQK